MAKKNYYSHETAFIDQGCKIGANTKIWHFSHIMPNCIIGKKCNIGQNVVISPEVILGRNVKVQNNVSIYDNVFLEDAVFCISGTSILETLLLRKKLLVFGNNIIIENFFPNLKCNFQNFNKKLSEHTLPQEIEIVNMLTYLKNISIDVGSEILIKKGNIEEIGKSFFNLFERIDNEDN